MSTLIHDRVNQCRNTGNPKSICRVRSGWVVLGDVQFLKGYSLLLPDPVVPDLNSLNGTARAQFLADMALLGDALMHVTDALRINYEILGNNENALHAHLFPRYAHEDSDKATKPVWFYDWRNAAPFDIARDSEIMEDIRSFLADNNAIQ